MKITLESVRAQAHDLAHELKDLPQKDRLEAVEALLLDLMDVTENSDDEYVFTRMFHDAQNDRKRLRVLEKKRVQVQARAG